MNFIPRVVLNKRKKDQKTPKSREKRLEQTNVGVPQKPVTYSHAQKPVTYSRDSAINTTPVTDEVIVIPDDEDDASNEAPVVCIIPDDDELSNDGPVCITVRSSSTEDESCSSTESKDRRRNKNHTSSSVSHKQSISTVLEAIENQKDPPYRNFGSLSPRKLVAVYSRQRTRENDRVRQPCPYYRPRESRPCYSRVSHTATYYGSRDYPIELDGESYHSNHREWDRQINYRSHEYSRQSAYTSYTTYRSHEYSRRLSTSSQSHHTSRQDLEQNEGTFGHPREWEYTRFGETHLTSGPESGELDFTVMSYNVLAQNLLEDNEHYLYQHCSSEYLSWDYRKERLLEEFKAHAPDILCLQEVNCTHFEDFFVPELEKLGYKGEYVKRTTDKLDGCASFYKTSKFTLEKAVPIQYYNPMGGEVLDRDNVALILKLVPKVYRAQGHDPDQPVTSGRLCVSNTHLLFNPKRGDVKLAQLMVLLAELDKCGFSTIPNSQNPYHGLIMCGDFNMEPQSDIYRLLTIGYLPYSGLSRKSLSGQFYDSHYSGPYLDRYFFPSAVGINDNCQYCDIVNERNKQRNDNAFEESNTQGSGCLSHNLKLLSAYIHRIARLNHREEEVTTHHGQACSTVDFIFFGVDGHEASLMRDRVVVRNIRQGPLKLVGRYGLLSETELDEMDSLPNKRLGSDHLCLIARFVWSDREI